MSKLPTKKAPPERSSDPSRYRRSSYQGNRQTMRSAVAGRSPVRRMKRPPEERAILHDGRIDIPALKAQMKVLAKSLLANVSIEKESLIRGLIIALLMIFFALLQTTIFTHLPPFGAVPDLMLSFAIAVAVSEGEKWGAVCSLFCALVISSLGSVGANELPLVYLACASLAGVMSHYHLRQNALIRLMYQVLAGFVKGIGTLVMFAAVGTEFTFGKVMVGTVIPEYFSTLLLSSVVHVITWLSLLYFHRSRAQRTGDGA